MATAIAFKLVDGRYRSLYLPAHLEPFSYRLFREPPGPVWAYSTIAACHKRLRDLHRPREGRSIGTQDVRIIALEHSQDVPRGDYDTLKLESCRVIGEVPFVELDTWPAIPGATVDLASVAALINARLFSFLLADHGVEHWKTTARNGAELLNYRRAADPDVVAAFALLHDSDPKGHDDHDGERVAVFARELQADGTLDLGAAQLDLLCKALADYPPRTTRDPTIAVCWDACRLATDVILPLSCFSTGAGRRRQTAWVRALRDPRRSPDQAELARAQT